MVKWSRSFPIYNAVTCGDWGHSCFLVLLDSTWKGNLLRVQLLQPGRFLLLVLWYRLSSVQHVSGSSEAVRFFHQLKLKLHYHVHQGLGIPTAPCLSMAAGKLSDNVGWKLLAWFMKEIKIWILYVSLSSVYAGGPSAQRSRPWRDGTREQQVPPNWRSRVKPALSDPDAGGRAVAGWRAGTLRAAQPRPGEPEESPPLLSCSLLRPTLLSQTSHGRHSSSHLLWLSFWTIQHGKVISCCWRASNGHLEAND